MSKKIFLVLLFAFFIRLIALNQSLWLDEAVTASVVKNFKFSQIISGFSINDFHPPLYYLFMKLWTNLFGYSEIALRMPSILFSLAAGYVVYLIGGVWSAVFFLFNPLVIYYSQEARMYMMATFFLTAGLYFFISDIKNKISKLNIKNQILFGIFASLSFVTFYGSIFLIIAMFFYLLFKKQYKYFFVSGFLFLISLLLISPLLYQQFMHSKISLSQVTNWSLVLGKANIKNLLLIPIKFSIGRISFLPKWVYWGISGLWTGFVWYLVLIKNLKVKNKKLNLKVKSLLFLLIAPLVLGFIVSFFTPMLQFFRFIYLIPVMVVLLAVSKNNLKYRYIVMTVSVIFSLVYLLLPRFHREDWKSMVKELPKDKPVYMITGSSNPVSYYSTDLKVNELTSLPQDYCGQIRLKKEIIVIPYTSDIYGFDYKSILKKSGYSLKKETSFRELTYEEWIK